MTPTIKTGSPVTGDDFFGREKDIEKFWGFIERGEHVLLVSPRRVGKTSLMRYVEAHPQKGWTPVFANLEGKTSAAAAIVEIVNRLKTRDGVGKKVFDAFAGALESAELSAGGFSLKVRQAAKENWDQLASDFEEAISKSTSKTEKLILIVDEFPIIIKRLFGSEETKDEAINLLQLFRKIGTDTSLKKRFKWVIGGSIGLKPILRRHKATADSNYLKTFRIGPWSKKTALAFMDAIATTHGFDLPEEMRDEVLKRTGETPIPFHLQKMLDLLIELDIPAENLTVDDLENVWFEATGDVDLDHYRERLDSVLEAEDAAFAQTVLDKVAFAGPQDRNALEGMVQDSRIASRTLRVLIEDGYFTQRAGPNGARRIEFANPMIAKFFREY